MGFVFILIMFFVTMRKKSSKDEAIKQSKKQDTLKFCSLLIQVKYFWSVKKFFYVTEKTIHRKVQNSPKHKLYKTLKTFLHY